jgi:hypothetical protein
LAQQATRASFQDAAELIAGAVSPGEGFRHGWIGNTGTGKTTCIRRFLERRGPLQLIHDDTKLKPQYAGAVVADFQQAPDDADAVLFRGDPFKGTTVDPDYVCNLALQIARATRQPVQVVIDELDRACSPGGKELASERLREILTQGRALAVSVVWSTQTPQRAPREVIDQSSTIALCQLGPRALLYLDERLMFDRALLDVVPGLEVGQFAIYQQGRPWNGTIYDCAAGAF